MLKIGAFSALSHISVRMLRYYDENGLLRPSHIDRFTGYRYYDENQLAEACRIALLRDMGFGVASISAILHGGRKAYRSALRQQRAELLRRRDEVTSQLILLEKALYRTEKEENPMEKYQVVCKTLPERYVASVRDVLPDYFYEGRLWHTLMQETAGLNLVPVEPCSFGIYHDGEYREHDVDVEIQFAVQPGAYADTAHVQFKTVPGACRLRGASRQLSDHQRCKYRGGRVGAAQRLRICRNVVQHLPCQPGTDQQSR